MAELSPIELQGEVTRLQRSLQIFGACNQALIRAETETNLLETISQVMVELGAIDLHGSAMCDMTQQKQWN
jgi:hypothetical protein